jgi:pyruvate formate lyase activating enzyme
VNEQARALLSKADLLLFDVKGIDPGEHKRCTGVSNELILKNLRELDAEGKPIIVRMPIIPGCNDADETVAAEAELLAGLRSLIRIDMIPYHDFGRIKFGQRGVAYPLEGTARLTDERVEEIKAILESRGPKGQVGG